MQLYTYSTSTPIYCFVIIHWASRTGFWIPIGRDVLICEMSRPALRLAQTPFREVPGLFFGNKVAGAWRWPHRLHLAPKLRGSGLTPIPPARLHDIYWKNLPLLSLLHLYRMILSVLDPRKCEYLKDYSLDFEHAYMTTYLASRKACRY